MKYSFLKKSSLILLSAIILSAQTGCGNSSAQSGNHTETAKTTEQATEKTTEKTSEKTTEAAAGKWVILSQTMTLTNVATGVSGTLEYAYSYDKAGNLSSVDASPRYLRELTYDENNNLLTDTSTATKSDGTSSVVEIEYTYTDDGRIHTYKKSTDGEETETIEYGYADSYYTELSDGRITRYDYEDHPLAVWNVSTNGSTTQVAQYSYDDHGNVTTYETNDNTIECENTYDEKGNLLKQFRKYGDYNGTAATGDVVYEYTYDEAGNMTSRTEYSVSRATGEKDISESDTYTYDAKNQLTYYKQDKNGEVTEYWYEYDENGNTVYQKEASPTRILEYRTTYGEAGNE